MRYWFIVPIALFSVLLCAYRPSSPEANPHPDRSSDRGDSSVFSNASPGGQLFRWSQQTATSDKVILFVHGRRSDIPATGPSQQLLESTFSFKVINFEFLGQESFGKPTSQLAEYWFYGYYPQQSPEIIAADLAAKIQNHPGLRGKQIAVIGYSQGGLVCWLLDQRYHLIRGGVLLGAPILGTPLSNKPIRDAAVHRIVSARAIADRLINFLDQFTEGAAGFERAYPETGRARSKLALYAGRILSSPLNVDILDTFIDMGWAKLGRMMETSNRRFARFSALVISRCDWRERQTADRQSDGTIPVSSATGVGIQVDSRMIWEEYDHFGLLTGGMLDFALDRATLDWLDQVLHLGPEFAEEDGVPQLPYDTPAWPNLEIPELPEISLSQADLLSYRFAYIHNGNPAFTNQGWSANYELDMGGSCSYPRFASDGKSLVFTAETNGNSAIYRLTGNPQAEPVVAGRYADFSPNGEWLAYEGAAGLCTWRFSKSREYCLVKNVQLVCPPLWVTKGLLGRIYFVAKAGDGSTNLYVVSPRARNKDLGDVDIVLSNCQGLFLARGLVSGVVAIGKQGDGYRLSIVSNWWQSNISFEIHPAEDDSESFAWDGLNFDWYTDQSISIQSAVLDQDDNYALYLELSDEVTETPGIYLFSLIGGLNDFSWDFDYELSEVASHACNLDLNPATR